MRSSVGEEEDTVCCPHEEIKQPCSSDSLSRCVQKSVCKIENKPACAFLEETQEKANLKSNFGTRSDVDEYTYEYSYEEAPMQHEDESCSCRPPRSVETLIKTKGLTEEGFVCCNIVVSPPVPTCLEGFKLVTESKCAFSVRLAIAYEEQIQEKQVCCPLRDVITCDPNNFRMVPESQCSIRVRSGGLWENEDYGEIGGEEDLNSKKEKPEDEVINKRQDRSLKDVCCAIEDIFEREEEEVFKVAPCDEGYTCVPFRQCEKGSENKDLLPSNFGLRQDSETPQQFCIPEGGEQDGNNFVQLDERVDYDSGGTFICCVNK